MTAPQCRDNPGIEPRRLKARDLSRLLGSFSAVDDESCWIWNRHLVGSGYGQFVVALGRRGNARREQAHRVVYKLFVGSIPPGLVLDHLCRVRHCVNPRHLEPVTSLVNTMRGDASPLARTECPSGHPYTGTNVAINRKGARRCRACDRERYHRRDREIERARDRERYARRIGGEPNPNALKTHCKHGHEFTPENTYVDPNGHRDCRRCGVIRAARYQQRKREAQR